MRIKKQLLALAVFMAAACLAVVVAVRIMADEAVEGTLPVEAMFAAAIQEEKGPQNLSAKADGMIVTLKWESFPYATGYNIYRSSSPDSGFIRINKKIVEGLSYIDSPENSVEPARHNVLYYYRVTATDGSSESADSNTVEARPYGALAPPKNITVISMDKSVILKWQPPDSWGDTPVAGYNIYRGLSEGQATQINKKPLENTEYKDDADGAGLTTGVRYYYVLQSVDKSGAMSGLSKPVQALTYSGISAPRGVTA
ncbi:MAG TPA: hypothetical protein P5511_05825, partial [Candidatus Goldiibacteriota bacterium]|nr:hypothetical protein [Candidatus Goldiibacteriota bacterium]